jgi:hypothetical protein
MTPFRNAIIRLRWVFSVELQAFLSARLCATLYFSPVRDVV